MTPTNPQRSYLSPVCGKNYDTNATGRPNSARRSYLFPVGGKTYDRWSTR